MIYHVFDVGGSVRRDKHVMPFVSRVSFGDRVFGFDDRYYDLDLFVTRPEMEFLLKYIGGGGSNLNRVVARVVSEVAEMWGLWGDAIVNIYTDGEVQDPFTAPQPKRGEIDYHVVLFDKPSFSVVERFRGLPRTKVEIIE